MVRFLRCPGVVVDLGSAQLARGPCVLAREGPTSEPRPLPHAGPAPPGTEEGRVWLAHSGVDG